MAKSWLTRSYNFIDKDPAISEFMGIWQKEHIKESDLAMLAGLSVSTVKNMFGGQTRRPAHTTFGKMAGAMGYEYKLGRIEKPDYDVEIRKAKIEFKAHKEQTAAKRKKRTTKKRG